MYAGNVARQIPRHGLKAVGDAGQRLGTAVQGQIGKINIHGQARQGAHEQVDSRTALEGKGRLLPKLRETTHQQMRLPNIDGVKHLVSPFVEGQ